LNRRRLRERCSHGVGRDVTQRHPRQITGVAAGDEGGDHIEVLAVGLEGVRRRLRTSVGEERGQPLRSRTFDAVSLLGAGGHAANIWWIMTIIHE
jgi:hypothetical protein